MIPYLVSPGRVEALCRLVEQWRAVVLDCETAGLNLYLGDLLMGIGLGQLDGEECYYLPVHHGEGDIPRQEVEQLKQALAGKPLVGYNIKFDLHAMAQYWGDLPEQNFYDVLVMAQLMSYGEHPILDLESVAYRELSYDYQSPAAGKQAIFGSGKLSLLDIGMKCCEDVDLTRRLYFRFKERMPEEVRHLFGREVQVTAMLYAMERVGIAFDPEAMKALDSELTSKKKEMLARLLELSGLEEFNPNSHPQVCKLMDSLGIKSSKRGKKGPSWDRGELSKIRHPVALPLAVYRTLDHETSRWIAAFKRSEKHGDCTLHGAYKNWGTVTGRLSGDLQSIPRGYLQIEENPDAEEMIHWEDEGLNKEISIRRLLVPRPGYVFLICDYKQLEMFIGGFFLRDANFLKLLEEEDFHGATAKLVWGVSPGDPAFSACRRRAKIFNFGLFYGMGDAAMAVLLKCSFEETVEYRREYFAKIPGYDRLYAQVHRQLSKEGCVSNVYGRPYYLPPNLAYVAINYLVQGSAGDYVKYRLPALKPLLQEAGILPVLTTHDDVVFEVPEELIGSQYVKRLLDILEEGSPFGFRLPVDAKVGERNLAEKEKLVLV